MPALAKALTAVKPAIAKYTALPVLTGVKVTARDGKLTVTATDLEATAVVSIDAAVIDEGTLVVSHAELAASIAKAKGQAQISDADEEVVVEHGITSRLRALPLNEWPRTSDPDWSAPITVDAATLTHVASFASTDETRPILTGVLFCPEGMVATDSYRLVTMPHDAVVDGTYLVSAKVAARAAKSAGKGGKVTVEFSNREARLTTDAAVWYVRLIEGQFPNYQGLIPSNHALSVTVDAAQFRELVTNVARVIPRGYTTVPVRFTITEGNLTASVVVQDIGEAEGSMPAKVVGSPSTTPSSGPELTVAFNPKFLLGCAAGTPDGDELVIELVDSLKPGMFHPANDPNSRALLMPIRIA